MEGTRKEGIEKGGGNVKWTWLEKGRKGEKGRTREEGRSRKGEDSLGIGGMGERTVVSEEGNLLGEGFLGGTGGGGWRNSKDGREKDGKEDKKMGRRELGEKWRIEKVVEEDETREERREINFCWEGGRGMRSKVNKKKKNSRKGMRGNVHEQESEWKSGIISEWGEKRGAAWVQRDR
ncbi:hypothetical protein Pcinc_040828 [Petrolisthes cinctipes]|uniref:Uncharacterized protein n=1 Tax=Petrolisthes cinctipes TaxID=88211 RepID=A0AAE1EHK3_PETCI|nr:hypothetical protein Pcinc_040828 [Petrolisthes cinctipes]